MKWLDDITNSMDMNLSKLQETVEDRGPWCVVVHGFTKSWTRFSNSTTTTLHRQECGTSQRVSVALKCGVVSFYELGYFMGNEWEDYFNYLGEGAELSRNSATAHFLVFDGQP